EGGFHEANKEQLSKTELSLTLTNKFDVSGSENEEMNARTLLLNTKRLIVDVIRFQPGETLTEILETPASAEQDADHQRAMQRRAIRDAKTPEKMKQNQVQSEENQMSLKEKKEKIEQNLKKLATLGKVNPVNKYQDLINDIAKVTPLAQGGGHSLGTQHSLSLNSLREGMGWVHEIFNSGWPHTQLSLNPVNTTPALTFV
ncbi:hypothetical protein chiPu_0024323, partial [Chiloscyllium punctatum]|nr:hypothetical protein [Chiloscyllium punctatum]